MLSILYSSLLEQAERLWHVKKIRSIKLGSVALIQVLNVTEASVVVAETDPINCCSLASPS